MNVRFNPEDGVVLIRSLEDGRDIVVHNLTFSRARVTIGGKYEDGQWKDGW